jgi:hypothetical protein
MIAGPKSKFKHGNSGLVRFAERQILSKCHGLTEFLFGFVTAAISDKPNDQPTHAVGTLT